MKIGTITARTTATLPTVVALALLAPVRTPKPWGPRPPGCRRAGGPTG